MSGAVLQAITVIAAAISAVAAGVSAVISFLTVHLSRKVQKEADLRRRLDTLVELLELGPKIPGERGMEIRSARASFRARYPLVKGDGFEACGKIAGGALDPVAQGEAIKELEAAIDGVRDELVARR
jgi:hypothetical protein